MCVMGSTNRARFDISGNSTLRPRQKFSKSSDHVTLGKLQYFSRSELAILVANPAENTLCSPGVLVYSLISELMLGLCLGSKTRQDLANCNRA